ncbi:MAG TPA: hypothetical protein VF708_05345 [Pyrinomonadaceae bacterium]|jgi:hypothetical protein
MKLSKFDPPGFLKELTAKQRTAWSDFISEQEDEAIAGDPSVPNDSPRAQFYNPVKTDTANDQAELVITWTAFPKRVKLNSASDKQRFQTADSTRDVQDEYCEWSVTRDPLTNKITRVTFTSEAPEYWRFLASVNPKRVLQNYQKFVSPNVQMSDLFDSQGRYISRNIFNNSTSNGAMHLVQGANTLSAEIELAADSSIVRVINGQMLTDEQKLIQCGRYGVETRNSDPHIGGQVNSITRQKADVTISNPVGLHINDLVPAGFITPDGSDPKSYWKIVRGTKERALRAVYEVPKSKGFVVGDITINGVPINFGGQIADFITIKIVGLACRFGQSTVAPQTGCKDLTLSAQPGALSVAAAISPPARKSRLA